MRAILPAERDEPLYSVAQTREIESRALAASAPQALMQRAGAALAQLALAIAPHARRVWIAAGPGNNGGDGLEAALVLAGAGKQVEVALHAGASTPADAQAALQRAHAAGIDIRMGAIEPSTSLGPDDIAIDALLGIGGTRAPDGPLAATIAHMNGLPCPVLAADVPSGLDADTGRVLGAAAVMATHTLTLLTLKPGLCTASGREHAGRIWLDDLGIDAIFVGAVSLEPCAWLSAAEARTGGLTRHHDQHKGSFGDVAVVGGAQGMTGAALLAARAAHAAGAGRVFVELLADEAAAPSYDVTRPELMFRPHFSADNALLDRATVVCGCGGGDAVRKRLPRLLGRASRLVLDADALNAIAADAGLATQLRARRAGTTVLTPHPLEAARLLGSTTAEVQRDRLAAARELADRYGAVIVLKGSGSIVAAPGCVPRINASGNAALATAGTGDVLAGWIGGRWACAAGSASMPDAVGIAMTVVVRAVAEHGAAAEPPPPGPLRANDLIEALYRAGV